MDACVWEKMQCNMTGLHVYCCASRIYKDKENKKNITITYLSA